MYILKNWCISWTDSIIIIGQNVNERWSGVGCLTSTAVVGGGLLGVDVHINHCKVFG